MSNHVTLAQVERLAVRLPLPEQLKLVAHISEQLSGLTVALPLEVQSRRERVAMANALLAELDAIAESVGGTFDSAGDIRQIREERAKRP
jgi:hypothetical protein